MATTTQQILDAAAKLGELIADHDIATRLESSMKALESNRDAQRALSDYNRHLAALGEKEAAGRPIEVEDKKKLQRLQDAVVSNVLLRNFQMAQMDYVDLLRRIDEAMLGPTHGALAPEGVAPPPASAPGGGPGIVTPDLLASH